MIFYMASFTKRSLRNKALLLSLIVFAMGAQQAGNKSALMNPSGLAERAPETFSTNFETSAGSFVIEVHRDWGPNGADRFYNLVKSGFYDGNRFYRVTSLMAVWGLHGDPEVAKVWLSARISDDPTHKHGNTKGTVAFFQSNKRTTQTFVNLVNNSGILDIQIAPFGEVVSGMDVVEKLYAGYGEAKPAGKGPEMNPFYEEGNAYLEREFPKLDYIKKATILKP
jgi:peptidyl-prolyl cis-trans isomerase A (cyclophilin A)